MLEREERDSLKGLPGVKVVVEHFDSAEEGTGFDRRTFQTDVELKLRMAGITASEEPGCPLLYLNVKTLHPESNRNSAYIALLQLRQWVLIESQLRSDPENTSEEALAIATTWAGFLRCCRVLAARASFEGLVSVPA